MTKYVLDRKGKSDGWTPRQEVDNNMRSDDSLVIYLPDNGRDKKPEQKPKENKDENGDEQ